jgi:hypothetical protein
LEADGAQPTPQHGRTGLSACATSERACRRGASTADGRRRRLAAVRGY